MPFLNVAGTFFREAIESVLSQTFNEWELLLIDDGSTNGATEIARQYAGQHPDRMRWLEHPGHETRGSSAARNLGIVHSSGEYMALLDADDVWLPEKLERQLPVLESHREAGMLYANTLFWHGWTGQEEDARRDYLPNLGVPANSLIEPPVLLALYLRGKAAVPCTCSVLMRSEAVRGVGGFDETFRDLYTDQGFYSKMVLAHRVFVMEGWFDRYRQHSGSCCAIAERTGRSDARRRTYLEWLETYLSARGMERTDAWNALQREIWYLEHPRLVRGMSASGDAVKQVRRASRRLASRLFPAGR